MKLTPTFCACPPTELSREFHANDFRALELPRLTRHRIDGIRSTNANARHTHASSVWRMRIRTNDQTTRAFSKLAFTQNHASCRTNPQRIVLQDDRMNDPRPRLPKPNPILPRSRSQEPINLPHSSAPDPLSEQQQQQHHDPSSNRNDIHTSSYSPLALSKSPLPPSSEATIK